MIQKMSVPSVVSQVLEQIEVRTRIIRQHHRKYSGP